MNSFRDQAFFVALWLRVKLCSRELSNLFHTKPQSHKDVDVLITIVSPKPDDGYTNCMDVLPTADELVLYDQVSALAAELWAESREIEGLNTDPKMFSIMLFSRLWSNHRGFTVLWNNKLYLEADIVLRSGVETAICIAANFKLRNAFVTLMKQDAAFTILGQIKIHRDNGETELVRDAEEALRSLQARIPTGLKAAKLDWKRLAAEGGSPQLYDYHRHLSGVSSHVTGFSILRNISGSDDIEITRNEINALTRKMHLMMMAGATLQGSLIHSGMIANAVAAELAFDLTNQLAEISMYWPGVESE